MAGGPLFALGGGWLGHCGESSRYELIDDKIKASLIVLRNLVDLRENFLWESGANAEASKVLGMWCSVWVGSSGHGGLRHRGGRL